MPFLAGISLLVGLAACSARVEREHGVPCGRSSPPEGGAPLWQRYFGEYGGGTSIVVDDDGNLLLAGTFFNTLDLGGVVLAAKGDHRCFFVAKLDDQGKALWGESFELTEGYPSTWSIPQLGVDHDGNVFVTGGFVGTLEVGGTTFSSGNHDRTFLTKLDGAGTLLWAKDFAASGAEIAIDEAGRVILATNGSGNFGQGPITAGSMIVALDSSGNPIFSEASTAEPARLAVDRSGDIYLSGPSDDGIVMAKLAADGHPLWSKLFGDSYDWADGIAVAADGSIVVTGFTGDLDLGDGPLHGMFIGKFDAEGNPVWSKSFEAAHGRPRVDECGNIVVAGFFEWTFEGLDFGGGAFEATGKADTFIAKLGPAGQHIWSWATAVEPHGKYFEDQSSAADLAFGRDGQVFVIGFFEGSIDLGGGVVSAPEWDTQIFVAAFAL